MEERYIAAAVPLFFLLIGFELWAQRRHGRAKYRFHDSIASLSCGVGQQTLNLGLTAAFLGAYSALFERCAIFRVSPNSPLGWAVLLFAVDLSYYALHRANHRVNVLWAGHAVHHQSEEYNLSTALRQSWLEALLGTPFYLPLAILGFPPAMFATMLTANTLYQFWIHTRSVGKLGALEGIVNTPSAHRVHHGVDPQYIDKNYGGMLSIWDRLFGTYEPEGVEPIYGTVKPLASCNPLWANVAEWARLWEMARATRKVGDKLWVWLAPPEWRPADFGGPVVVPEVDREHYTKYDVSAPRGVDGYVLVHFAVVTLPVTGLLWFHQTMARADVMVTGAWILASLVAWSGLFEGRRWAGALELGRLLGAVGIAAWLSRGTAFFVPAAIAVGLGAIASAAWMSRYPIPQPPRA